MQKFISLRIACSAEKAEFLMAELEMIGFDTFMETDEGFEACVLLEDFSESTTLEILTKYQISSEQYAIQTLEQQNWNAQWESSFEPVYVDNELCIRAPFHAADNQAKIELVIQPKTSFGTGHHETTFSILTLMLKIDFEGLKVFDYGSGTGILAILAKKLGAKSVLANDIDDWAAENILENIGLNQVSAIDFIHGDLSVIPQEKFDVILANINRNVLEASMGEMAKRLMPNGKLLISGFYEADLAVLNPCIQEANLSVQTVQIKNNWCAAILTFR